MLAALASWSLAGDPEGRIAAEHGAELTWLRMPFAAAVFVTIVAGGLHGTSMWLRKLAGEVAARQDRSFYTSKSWWFGFGVDFTAGAILWFAMPVLAVQVLLPICLVSQVATAYLIGRCWLGEPTSLRKQLGVLFAMLGVGLLAYSVTKPVNFPAEEFWTRWANPLFLQTLSLLAVISTLAFMAEAHLGWLCIASFSDAVQFLCSRTLANTILYNHYPFQAWCILVLKMVLCAVFLHFQQLALKGPLSRVGAEYPVIDSFLTTILAAPFFGDSAELSRELWGGAIATAVGLWLLMEQDPVPEPLLEREADEEKPAAADGYGATGAADG